MYQTELYSDALGKSFVLYENKDDDCGIAEIRYNYRENKYKVVLYKTSEQTEPDYIAMVDTYELAKHKFIVGLSDFGHSYDDLISLSYPEMLWTNL